MAPSNRGDKAERISTYCDKPMQNITKKVVEFLSEYGAVDLAEKRTTPLHWAVWLGSLDIIKVFLDEKVDIDTIDGNKYTPVRLALELQRFDIARFLLDNGANIGATDGDGSTLLHYGVKMGIDWLVVYSMVDEVDINAKDGFGKTALHYAVRNKKCDNREIVRCLLDGKADVNVVDKVGMSPLHYAVDDYSPPIARLLVRYGADVGIFDSYGFTPLHCAALHRSKELAQLLLENGADVGAIDGSGKAPIHHALAYPEVGNDIVEILLDQMSDINIEDKQGCIPFGTFFHHMYKSDTHDHGRIIIRRSRRPILRLFKLHTVKLKAAGLYISEENLQPWRYKLNLFTRETQEWMLALNLELIHYRLECKKEVDIMKSSRLSPKVSLYDVLTAYYPRYTMNKATVLGLDKFTFSTIPIYKSLVRSKFEIDKKRFPLLVKSKLSLKKLMSPVLPDELLEKISSHLTNRDLQNLILCATN